MSQSHTMYHVVREFFDATILQGRNAQRENLLHYVCHCNQYELILPFLAKGCRLCQQDLQGRTPVHVAIEMDHQKCIQVFRKLLQNFPTLNECIQKDVRKLFQIYNNKGHTILHEAALRDMQDTVRDMLNFCKEYQINVADNEVLGCGDSILHLLVRENLLEMATIVCDSMPHLVKFPNYGGILPQDLSCLSAEMGGILKNAIEMMERSTAN